MNTTIYVNNRKFTVLKKLTSHGGNHGENHGEHQSVNYGLNQGIDYGMNQGAETGVENWLVMDDASKYIIQKIHARPESYLEFGNRLESLVKNYKFFREIGIRVPVIIDIDINHDFILKEYLDGKKVDTLVAGCNMKMDYIRQIEEMSAILYRVNKNINYMPSNYVIANGILYYTGDECVPYEESKNFANYGKMFWARTKAFLAWYQRAVVS